MLSSAHDGYVFVQTDDFFRLAVVCPVKGWRDDVVTSHESELAGAVLFTGDVGDGLS